jgi:hypothetical protein
MINSTFYKVASGWFGQSFGLDLNNVVLGVCIFTAAQVFSVKALDWLESNGTNTVSIPHNETLVTDLEMWVALYYNPPVMISYANVIWPTSDQASNS